MVIRVSLAVVNLENVDDLVKHGCEQGIEMSRGSCGLRMGAVNLKYYSELDRRSLSLRYPDQTFSDYRNSSALDHPENVFGYNLAAETCNIVRI